MITDLRKAYNTAFTDEKYATFLNHLYDLYQYKPTFRISETPVFIPDDFRDRLIQACEDIADVLTHPDFKKMTDGAIAPGNYVPNEDAHSTFLVIDFGVCEEGNLLVPKLIELQGFPSLYFFQQDLADLYKADFDLPKNMTPLFAGLDTEGYYDLLKEVIVGDNNPKNVVLLEVEPEKQNTQIDFWATAARLGIKVLCLTKVIKVGNQLFYKDDNGEHVRIEKIYNRVIFDELSRRPDLNFRI